MRSVYVSVIALVFQLSAFAQGSSNVSLVYHWNDTSLLSSWAHNNRYNEIWGLAEGGREYAVIGSTMGTHIFDITDPANVDTAVFIPGAATGLSIVHRDFHDYNGYLYIVCDEDSQLTLSTLQIVDLSFLPNSAPVVYNSNALFRNSHNIFIDSTNARLYACGVRPSGNRLEIYSLADPVNPVLIETYDKGRHDIYVRNDTAYLNDGNQGFFVVDFETPGNPISLGSLTSYIDSGYNHSGWLSDDGSVYALADENFGHSIKLLDVSDLSNMSVLSTISSGVAPLSIPHNLIIKGSILYASYYNDGLYIFNIADPLNPVGTGYYDTSAEPHVDGNYRGAWGVYPSLPSGLILVSDMQNGLFVLDGSAATGIDNSMEQSKQHTEIYPNPFKESLSIAINVAEVKKVHVEVYNELGQLVSSSNHSTAGNKIVIDTRHLPSGLYEVILSATGWNESHKLIKTR
ncbi:MAG TPA: choice-of-anchor B family protein [Flavobacteriales bacterium]|nr:choice-of-anchor B family protein [Flavobacteriales bacterium]